MATITGLTGNQYTPGTQDYTDNRYQYATSSEPADLMSPALIIEPKSKEDIAKTLQYAKTQKIAVAIRTGGHQYSGASSTSAPNIQLDLKWTFRSPDDKVLFQTGDKTFVRTSVSWALGEFNAWLGSNNVFVPHGECEDVHVGGHVQSGGYGQLARSFGLFGDHVTSLEIVDHNGAFKEVTKAGDPDLFYAILGGSPGNLGVITHFTIEVHRDSDYHGSMGLKAMYWYNTKTLNNLLDILAQMAEDENFPRNYDFTVSVLSSSFPLLDLFPEVDEKMRREHPELYGKDNIPFWPRTIVVFAQWVPFDKNDVPDMAWFDRISENALFCPKAKPKPMSQLTSDWIFRNVREFDHPYIKSTRATNSKTLVKDGWASWVTDRVDKIVKPDGNRCWISAQFQCMGGKDSKFFTNADNGTAYSWRDSSLICTMDCFYEGETAEKTAAEWQKTNAIEGVGPNGKMSKDDRRLLWGSFGSRDLDANWRLYYEYRAKYDKLRKARQTADPDGIFTPNTFSVKR